MDLNLKNFATTDEMMTKDEARELLKAMSVCTNDEKYAHRLLSQIASDDTPDDMRVLISKHYVAMSKEIWAN